MVGRLRKEPIMLRCHRCRGHAHAGLAHLHHLPVPLCSDCTRKELERQEANRAAQKLQSRLTVEHVRNTVRKRKAA